MAVKTNNVITILAVWNRLGRLIFLRGYSDEEIAEATEAYGAYQSAGYTCKMGDVGTFIIK